MTQRRKRESSDMGYACDIVKINEQLYCLKEVETVSRYLVIGSERALLFDTGYGFTDLSKEIRKLTDKPLYVVDSHADIDHCLGNYLFEEVYISKYDYDQLTGLDDPEFKKMMMDRKINGEHGEELRKVMDADAWMAHSVFECRYHFLSSGDVFDLGDLHLEVIEVPGHTRGSIVLLCKENGCLLGADSLYKMGTTHFSIPKYERRCAPLFCYYQALKRLQKRIDQIKVIYAAHGDMEVDPSCIKNYMKCIKDLYFCEKEDPGIADRTGIMVYSHTSEDSKIQYSKEVLVEMKVHFRGYDWEADNV